jgi:hypothetical protein
MGVNLTDKPVSTARFCSTTFWYWRKRARMKYRSPQRQRHDAQTLLQINTPGDSLNLFQCKKRADLRTHREQVIQNAYNSNKTSNISRESERSITVNPKSKAN